jgi:hypothetical protein
VLDNQERPDLEVISLNVWENAPEKAEAYMREHGFAMRLLYGTDEIAEAFGVEGIPTLVVIDQEGIIRYREVGVHEGLRENLGWYTEEILGPNI